MREQKQVFSYKELCMFVRASQPFSPVGHGWMSSEIQLSLSISQSLFLLKISVGLESHFSSPQGPHPNLEPISEQGFGPCLRLPGGQERGEMLRDYHQFQHLLFACAVSFAFVIHKRCSEECKRRKKLMMCVRLKSKRTAHLFSFKETDILK